MNKTLWNKLAKRANEAGVSIEALMNWVMNYSANLSFDELGFWLDYTRENHQCEAEKDKE